MPNPKGISQYAQMPRGEAVQRDLDQWEGRTGTPCTWGRSKGQLCPGWQSTDSYASETRNSSEEKALACRKLAGSEKLEIKASFFPHQDRWWCHFPPWRVSSPHSIKPKLWCDSMSKFSLDSSQAGDLPRLLITQTIP